MVFLYRIESSINVAQRSEFFLSVVTTSTSKEVKVAAALRKNVRPNTLIILYQ